MIDQKYSQIIDSLKKGHRFLDKLGDDEILILKENLESTKDAELLKKIFCIIDNTQTRTTEFSKGIIKILNEVHPTDIYIYALEASRKHVLEANFIKGHRLDLDSLNTFKSLLTHESPEVVEWTLRVIDEMGGQGIYFKSTFEQIKPKITLFNKHKRHVKMIINMLEKRWEPVQRKV